MITSVHHTFYGLDKWPGITVGVSFGLLALVVIGLPPRHRRMVRWSLLMTVLAGLAITHTLLMKGEVESSLVVLIDDQPAPPAYVPDRLSLSHRSERWNVGQDVNALQTEAASSRYRMAVFQMAAENRYPRPLADLSHRLTYRSGFYTAFGLSVVLLVLSATGVRHSLAHGADDLATRKQTASGTPLATVRFAVRAPADLSARIRFHFGSLDYEPVRSGAGEWVFHRGRALAGLTSMDLRAFDTTLTVRAAQGTAGHVWISCSWNVRTMGAMILRSDIQRLEAEAHELEKFLQAGGPPDSAVDGSRSGVVAEPGRDGTAAAAGQPSPQFAATSGSGISDMAAEDLDELQSVIDGPAMVLIAAGGLTAIVSLILYVAGYSDPYTDDIVGLCLPGMAIGVIVAVGAWYMRHFRSRGLAMTGAVFGLIPATVGSVLLIPLSIWALNVLNRSDVRRAFVVESRRRKLLQAQRTEPCFSRKAIVGACLVPLFLLSAAAFLLPASTSMQFGPGPRGGGTEPPLKLTLTFLAIAVGAAGLTAPLLTTILGFMAISDIRSSRGRLVGLGLAFFDASIYPILLLNGLIFAAALFASDAHGHTPAGQTTALLTLCVVLLIADAVLLWWLWRRVSSPPGRFSTDG